MLKFPEGFVWGAATSAYQIEGAVEADGRGESIWDRFARTPGMIEDGATGAAACDHYHRWPEDLALMSEMGLGGYRFSIAWPRVLPDGETVNEAGLDFYDRLVDGLLERGIRPAATLYHWDLPQILEDRGGWPDRGILEPYLRYADVVTRRLGDRVKMWITHNEPSIVAWLGYLEGVHAPGRRSWPDALAAVHHVLLSHGQAVPVIRANAPGAEVGAALMLVPAEPASSSDVDAEATAFFDGMWNRWFFDPMYGLSYPQDFVDRMVSRGFIEDGALGFVQPGDMETIATPCDFLGINLYSRHVGRGEEAGNAPREVVESTERTDMDWEVWPQALETGLRWVHERYAPGAIYVTENGAAYGQGPGADGHIQDEKRIAYLGGHLRAAHRAIAAGVPLRGYFTWSLLDNFEWGFGKTKRFGLVWVDYETLERTPKASAWWYRDVIARGGLEEVG